MYQHVLSPLMASFLEDSKAIWVYLSRGSAQVLCKKDIDLASASTSMGGAAISALMIS